MFANEELFLLGLNENEEVACGLLGLGEGQGVGRAHTALPAPSQCPFQCWSSTLSALPQALAETVLVSHVIPHAATRGRPIPPATMRLASQRTPSGRRRSLSCRNSIDPVRDWSIVPSRVHHIKSPWGTEEEMGQRAGGWSRDTQPVRG